MDAIIDRFFAALESDDPSEVEQMLAENPELVNARDASGQSAILFAAYRGATETVDLLRGRGASLDVWEAAAVGDAARLRELLANGETPIHALSADGWTPLHLATFFGHLEATELLLASGADPRAWSGNGIRNTPLHAALAGVRRPEVVQRLLDAGADPSAVAGGGYTPLHLAASRGEVVLIEALLALGAKLTRTGDGKSAADLAADRGHIDAAEHLRRVEELRLPASPGPAHREEELGLPASPGPARQEEQ